MKLELGKRYVRRDGKVTGPLESHKTAYFHTKQLERELAAALHERNALCEKLTVAREALALALHVRGTSDDNEDVRSCMDLALTLTTPK